LEVPRDELVILQPEKVATPADVVVGEHVSEPFDAPVLIASDTDVPFVGTTSPFASSSATTGCGLRADPLLLAPGVVVKTSCVAVPATVNGSVVSE
jgi:hypothetical protein